MNRYLFIVTPSYHGPILDGFYKCQGNFYTGTEMRTDIEDFHPLNMDPDTQQDTNTAFAMSLRARFAPGDLCIVATEEELDRDTLQTFLEGKHALGELEDFIRKNRMS